MQAVLTLPPSPLGLHAFVPDFAEKAKNLNPASKGLPDRRRRPVGVGAVDKPRQLAGYIISLAKIGGDFARRCQDHPQSLPTIRLTVTRIDPESLWAGVSKLPGLTVEFEHIIECADSARLLVERGILTGPFAVVAARLIGNRLAATFAALTAQVTRRVEAQA
jgi:hypothetical protein